MAIKYVVYVDENGRMVYRDANESGENVVVTDSDGKIDSDKISLAEVDVQEIEEIRENTLTISDGLGNVNNDVKTVLSNLSVLQSTVEGLEVTSGTSNSVMVRGVGFDKGTEELTVNYDSTGVGNKITLKKSGIVRDLTKGEGNSITFSVEDLVVNEIGCVDEEVELEDGEGNLIGTYRIFKQVEEGSGQIVLVGLKTKFEGGRTVLNYDYNLFESLVEDGNLDETDITEELGIQPTNFDRSVVYPFRFRNKDYFPTNNGMDYFVDVVMEATGKDEVQQLFFIQGEVRQERVFSVEDYSLEGETNELTINYVSTRSDVELILNGYSVGTLDAEGQIVVNLDDMGLSPGYVEYVMADIKDVGDGSTIQSYDVQFDLKIGTDPVIVQPNEYDSSVLPLTSLPTNQDLQNLGLKVSDNEDGDITDQLLVSYYDAFSGQDEVFLDVEVFDSDGNRASQYLNFPNNGFSETEPDTYVEVVNVANIESTSEFEIALKTFTGNVKIDVYNEGNNKILGRYLDDYDEDRFYVDYDEVGYSGTETGLTLRVDVFRKGEMIESGKVINLT
ncbi:MULTISPECIES: hypothetical protein [Pontibacillus]|uniref:Uncharacterized protein n=1 Tax=Pontibacillus chungwhensis TaxID=265426 RepID=A0ABY8V3U7_9BACI|nr:MULTISPECIES: hypothetical protein [Pontibacillus]MCD5326131.1 hypothetical protein [Pontibacillus sp. HN14]WIG00311.1 hypothetical protein QNI29_20910 [Pontibacillus chungwhensis]